MKKYKLKIPKPISRVDKIRAFEKGLEQLINSHSIGAYSNTPDRDLAYFLVNCLLNYEIVKQRAK